MILEIKNDAKYRRSDEVVFKEADGEIIIIPSHSGVSGEEQLLFTLTGTSALIWSLLDGTNTVQQMIDQVARRYDAPADQISLDVVAFLQELATGKMITD